MNPLLDPAARLIVGHRGAAARAPENTLESFAAALAAGADALEFDVRLTADGVPVVHHDATLERTTDGTGPLAARTLADLRALDAGARHTADGGRSHPWRGRGVRVPTLDEVLGAFPGVPVIVEVKLPEAAAPARRVLERHAAAPRAVVAAFADASVAAFRDSAFALGATRRDTARLLALALAGARRVAPPRFQAVSAPPRFRGLPLPLARFARLLAPHGCPVHVWTVDDAASATRFWSAGISGVLSNDPAALVPGRPPGPRSRESWAPGAP